PMAAQRGAQADFFVLIAPPGVPLDELLMRQAADMGRVNGVDEQLLARIAETQRAELELITDPELGAEELRRQLMEGWERQRGSYTEEDLRKLQLTDAQVRQSIQMVATPWFRSLMRLDPADYLGPIEQPTLALF